VEEPGPGQPAYEVKKRRRWWLLESSWSVFFFCWGGWILIRRGFLLSPHIYIHTHTHTHTHTHKTSCVPCRGPGPLPPWSPWVLRDSAHPKKERKKKRERGEFPFKKESLKLLLVAESRVRRYETIVTTASVLLRVCVVCLCLGKLSNFWIAQWTNFFEKKPETFSGLSKVLFFFPPFGPECCFRQSTVPFISPYIWQLDTFFSNFWSSSTWYQKRFFEKIFVLTLGFVFVDGYPASSFMFIILTQSWKRNSQRIFRVWWRPWRPSLSGSSSSSSYAHHEEEEEEEGKSGV
jgi:hypothetical protein